MPSYDVFGRQVFSLSRRIIDNARGKHYPEITNRLKTFKIIQNYNPESLAINKFKLPPGGNEHDYFSQGAFWWPNPDSPDGLPYINRDGNINPESENTESDKNKKNRMFANIYTFAALYFFTGEEAMAEKAATFIRCWFLIPETRMSPHVDYGQAIPGICSGRDAGIIEFHHLIQIIDAIYMIEDSSHWKGADQEGMRTWLAEFLNWLRSSKIGVAESKAPNNHGAWHAALCMKIASFCECKDVVGEYIGEIKRRIAQQIQPDGSMPEELKRTQPWHYSIFCTNAFLVAATVASDHGEDLFHYQTKNNPGIKASVDFLAGFATGDKQWGYPELYLGEYGSNMFQYCHAPADGIKIEDRFSFMPKTWPCPELYGFLPEKLTPALYVCSFYYNDNAYSNILARIPEYDDSAAMVFLQKHKV